MLLCVIFSRIDEPFDEPPPVSLDSKSTDPEEEPISQTPPLAIEYPGEGADVDSVTPASSFVHSSTPASIPYHVYEQLVRECDLLHSQNMEFQVLVDALASGVTTLLLASSAGARLKAMIRSTTYEIDMASTRSSVMEPGEIIQWMLGELQRTVDGRG